MSASVESGEWKKIQPSQSSMRMKNPIRAIVDQLKPVYNPDKPLISLSIGDPTVFGNLRVPDSVNEELIKNTKSLKYNGYTLTTGNPETKRALAKRYSYENLELKEEDVIMSSSCSGGLQLCFTALANPGQNMLLPSPGFTIYKTLCDHLGVESRFYHLLAEREWEADLDHMASLVDENTVGILVNNPSNPCGSNYTKEHLLAILAFAERFKLPIISDEIYENMVHSSQTFYPLGSLTNSVPVLTVSGLSKVFIVPGWRMGWILFYDKLGLLNEIREAVVNLTTLILGPNTLVQSILPTILFNTPKQFFLDVNRQLEEQTNFLYEHLSKIRGLHPVRAQGAMYTMLGIEIELFEDISDDLEFARKLLAEECVVVLPGRIFGKPNFVRLVVCPPIEVLSSACKRIEEFCTRHLKKLTN